MMGPTRSSTLVPAVSQSQPQLMLPTNSASAAALKQPNVASQQLGKQPPSVPQVSRMYSGVSTATPGLSPRSMLSASTPRTTGNSIVDDSVANSMVSMMRSNSTTKPVTEPTTGSTFSIQSAQKMSSPTAGQSMARITSMSSTHAGSAVDITTKSSEGAITWKGSDAVMTTARSGSGLMIRVATNGSVMQSSSTLGEVRKAAATASAPLDATNVASRSALPRTQESRAIVLNSAPVSLSAASARLPLLQTLLRVGPRFSHRPSELVAMAETLEEYGISSTDAIQSLSDDLASDIGVPLRLVAALKAYTEDPEEWMRNGAVRLLPYQSAAPHNPELAVRAPWTGHPTYEADPHANRLKVFDTLGGFPTQLREQSTGRAFRRASSKEALRERRERSISQHRVRLQNARERREESLAGGRARSEEREEQEEDILQAWKVTRMSSVNLPVSKAGRPYLACCASPQASVEQTADISLTLPRRDYEESRLSPRVVAAKCEQLADRSSALESAEMSLSASMPVAILKRTPVSLGEPLRLPLRSDRTPSRQARLPRQLQTART